MKNMIMTEKLANQLMDDLACVCISANGGVSLDENGEPILTEQQLEAIHEYVNNTFCSIMTAWEEITGKSWSIETEE